MQFVVLRRQLPDQSRHTLWRGIELAHVSDLSITTTVRAIATALRSLATSIPTKTSFGAIIIRPPVMRTNYHRHMGCFSVRKRAVSLPRPIIYLALPQATSGMAAGHRAAAHSVLDDGEHNATLDRSGIERFRGSVLMKTDMRSYDIATEAYDVFEVQLPGQQPVEILIAEASIGDDADARPRRHDLGQADQHAA